MYYPHNLCPRETNSRSPNIKSFHDPKTKSSLYILLPWIMSIFLLIDQIKFLKLSFKNSLELYILSLPFTYLQYSKKLEGALLYGPCTTKFHCYMYISICICRSIYMYLYTHEQMFNTNATSSKRDLYDIWRELYCYVWEITCDIVAIGQH